MIDQYKLLKVQKMWKVSLNWSKRLEGTYLGMYACKSLDVIIKH